MLMESVRAYLASLGVEGVETWTTEELVTYIDNVLAETALKLGPEDRDVVFAELLDGMKDNMHTIAAVVNE